MSASAALDGFLDKWRSRWPEWALAETFLPPPQRPLAVAWFALLQEFDDILNIAGDPLPADAKLAWWGEELRSWQSRRSRHPLGRVLEPVPAPWEQLSATLPGLLDARKMPADAADAYGKVEPFARAVTEVERALFGGSGPAADKGDAVRVVATQVLAQRLAEAGTAALPRVHEDDREQPARGQWAQALLRDWPARAGGPRPRRIWSALARARHAQRMQAQPRPIAAPSTLWRAWRAGRGG